MDGGLRGMEHVVLSDQLHDERGADRVNLDATWPGFALRAVTELFEQLLDCLIAGR